MAQTIVYQKAVHKYLDVIQGFLLSGYRVHGPLHPKLIKREHPGDVAVSESVAWLHDLLYPIARTPGKWDLLNALSRGMLVKLRTNAPVSEVNHLIRVADHR